jgi:hypothetical protein
VDQISTEDKYNTNMNINSSKHRAGAIPSRAARYPLKHRGKHREGEQEQGRVLARASRRVNRDKRWAVFLCAWLTAYMHRCWSLGVDKSRLSVAGSRGPPMHDSPFRRHAEWRLISHSHVSRDLHLRMNLDPHPSVYSFPNSPPNNVRL